MQMQSVKDILKKFNPTKDKYVSREFQSYGVHLAQKLGDERHISLYIRLAKTIHRPILEQALRFVIDANARSKSALFMWKLNELGGFRKKNDKLQITNDKSNPKSKWSKNKL